MDNSYKMVYKAGQGEIIEKKSRFIANVFPVDSEEKASGYIEEIKKKYWDARHNCYAYVIGNNNEIQRYSDDGEPQKTAGVPMLDVIMNMKIHNCLVIVTRYFGGILLGTGGLVRAYQAAAKEGITNTEIIEKKQGSRINVICDYTDVGKLQYIIDNEDGIYIENSIYTADVEFKLIAEIEKKDVLADKITESTSGRALVEIGETLLFGIVNGKIITEN